ncbi:hypothetical protein LSH36_501g07006 [Paralvinella palmiformis]|uniref:Rho-GAP domain-containing protein n=1 Tax=Paralvinella palmiformis TaxID=53620 RepID=A0AAD9J8E2_9ANNE|nr:hypothetical protein LSH36_501g07006 [Paralvinella palmiformis]
MCITQQTIDQILPLINYLKNDSNLKQEGLFRKSGHIGRQKLLKEKLQNGEDVKMELESGIYSAHDCASVLKALLSELQEPVLTEKHYPAHCQVTEMELESKQLQTLQLLLQLLPSENLFLLQCLLTLLHKVAQEPANKMTSENLGMLFAPHLLMPRKMRPSELQTVVGNLTKIVSFMINNAYELFKLPRPLICDIATYWTQREEPSIDNSQNQRTNEPILYQSPVNQSDAPINTSVTFTDREASQQAATKTDTEMELAQLYAYVSSMPSLAKKRKLLKQFNKAKSVALASSPASSSNRHKRTKSFGDSIKKIICRNHQRHGSSHSLQIQREMENLKNSHFPVSVGK